MLKQTIVLLLSVVLFQQAFTQVIPNGDFKKWDEYGCPAGWGCNNDADCKGKVTKADKINGGAKLMVMHCVDITKEDRGNDVNISYDELSAKIIKNKKVKISFDYSYMPVGNDMAYVKIDVDFDEVLDKNGNTITGSFEYNGNKEGILKAGLKQHMDCYINFDNDGKLSNAPVELMANSIRTTFAIAAAPATEDVHKGSTLIINHVKFSLE